MELLPAIDILGGKCVRLSQGDYNRKKVYADDPLEMAKRFESWGLRRLHLVDLDGARSEKIINYKIIERIALNTSLIIDFGGGLKSDEDLKIAFESGASMITGGTIAVKNESLFLSWLEKYGQERIILGADHKKGKIAVTGWGEESDNELNDFISSYHSAGIRNIICTDIDKDGMLCGPSINIYKEIISQFREIFLMASGGVSSVNDLYELKEAGLSAAIIGKAIYEGKIKEKDLLPFLI
jgi:phosphoribosylformimino-5-aminoimidazole carboxamide ribotide isomerase